MDIRETISAQVDALENAEVEAPVVETPPEVSDDRPRGLDGKFVAKESAIAAPQEPVSEVVAEVKPRPSVPMSWKKDYHKHWETLPPEVAEYILQREQEAADGIGKHRGANARIQPYADAVAPYEPILRQHGLDPIQHVGALLTAHQRLALGSPQEKLAMFQKLAQDYGVQIQALTGQAEQVDPTINAMWQELRKTQGMVQGWQQQSQAQQEAQVRGEIDVFARDPQHQHFERLKPAMAKLLSAGMAETMNDAYQQALRLDVELFESEQVRKHESDEQERRKKADAAAKLARAAAASPRSSSPSADMATRNSGKRSLRDIVSDAVDQHAGRV